MHTLYANSFGIPITRTNQTKAGWEKPSSSYRPRIPVGNTQTKAQYKTMTSIDAANILMDLLAEMLKVQLLKSDKLTNAQSLFLFHLSKAGPMTMTDISKTLGHSTAASTGFVDRLERLNYVQRRHASKDRRKVTVILAKKGVEFVGKTRQRLAALAVRSESKTADLAQTENPQGAVIRVLRILTAAAAA